MSDRLRQNRYCLFSSRTKNSILGLVLLVFIFLLSSLFNGGAGFAQAQTGSNSPPFQLQMLQKYSHPTYPELRISVDNRLLMVNGLPAPWDGLPMPIELSELPENKWIQLRTPPRRQVPDKHLGGTFGEERPGDPLPVAVMRSSCNVMRGCSVMAQWLP